MSNQISKTNFNKKIFIKVIAFTLISIIFLSSYTTASFAKSNYDIKIDAEVAYDRTVKIGEGNAIIMDISNNGKDFKGEIEIKVDSSPENELVFVEKIELPQGSTKRIIMNFTLFTIQKDFTINIVKDNKIIASTECMATKVLPPDALVIGIISDNQESYNFMSGYESVIASEYGDKAITNQGVQSISLTSDENTIEANIIYLDSFENFESENQLQYFDIIVIGNKKDLDITTNQEKLIDKWIESGNALIISTGENYKSIYKNLPKSLTPYSVTGVNEYSLTQDGILSDLSRPVILTEGDTTDLTTIYSNDGIPLALNKNIGLGGIVTLTFNPEVEPIKSWNGKLDLMSYILDATPINRDYSQYNGYYMPRYYHQFAYQTKVVPTEKNPPYRFMVYVFIVYILIVGPGLYFVLKKADKRDSNWLLIPAVSLLCMLTIYVFGFKTRYNKPVLNTVSMINIDTDADLMSIETDMSLFNNKKGKLVLSWPSEFQVAVDYVSDNQSYYYGEEVENKKTIGRITYGNENIFEIYNTGLWSSRQLSSSKLVPIDISSEIISLDFSEDGMLKGTVVNNTPLNLEDAFISLGRYYIFIGDLVSGQERSFAASYLDKSNKNFEDFFNTYYRKTSNNKVEYDYEIERIRDIFSNTISYKNNLEGFKLIGINKDLIDYGIKANQNTPETYSTNVVVINQKMKFNSGEVIVIPSGAITADIKFMRADGVNSGDYSYDMYNDSIYAYENGCFEFTWTLPIESIDVTKINILFEDDNEYGNTNENTGITYYIYNNSSNEWDEITNEFDFKGEAIGKYISSEGIIKTKQDFSESKFNDRRNRFSSPTILIEGVSK